jgi:hypothetical protein
MANVFEGGGKPKTEWEGILGFILKIPMVSPCGIAVVLETMRKDEDSGKFHVQIACNPAFREGLIGEMVEVKTLNMFTTRMLNLLATHGLPANLVDSGVLDGELLFHLTRENA